MILELQGTDGVGHTLDGVLDRMGKIVHRINAPLISGVVMVHVGNAVNDRVAHVHVAAGHVDLGAEHFLAILELSVFHPLKQIKILFHGTVPVRTLLARLF